MKIIIGLIAIFIIFILASLNWRLSVKTVFFIVVTEGALRKWVLPQASEIIYFLKDFVLLGACIRYYLLSSSSFKNRINSNFIKPLIFFCAGWCFFQALNPSLGSPIIGILGIKSYLLYVLFLWILPGVFQSEKELFIFLRNHLLLVIPVGILGIIQSFSPPDSPINAYVEGEVTNVATFQGDFANLVRVTGSFSYLDGYAVYLLVSFGLLIPLLAMKQSWWWRCAFILEILLVIVNSLMTGSRSSVFAIVLFLMGYIGIKALVNPASSLGFLKKFFLPVIAVVIAASIWFKPAINAFFLRTTSNNDVYERIEQTFTQPIEFIKYKGLDGYGAGATQSGATALRQILDLPKGEIIPVYFEEEPERVTLELGPIGLILWYGLRLSMIVALGLVFLKLKNPFLRELALAAFLIHGIRIQNLMVFQPTFAVYYWFLSSFIFLLPHLEKRENWQRKQQRMQQNVTSTYLPDSSYY